ncbi:organic hydroperoxide resistance protein [Aliidiomarina minuta]|uniref:Organic hydroperoxide resistance protein n=1 Tax=Aliidiomarina minuta TaxID=880057 RepID=A0A432W775_9GAMM|nr:organic hydroperoxide resistance protein [Aliidiomarina minuta]RUO25927.1 organic hydroperoxide resistance protein [Aliidiomarina minuta]
MAFDKVLYTAYTEATGGRDGRAVSNDGALDVSLSVPKEMGGQGGEGTNPEQLFAAGYSACFLGALGAVAGKEEMKLPKDASIKAAVSIGETEKNLDIEVELHISLPGLDADEGKELIEKAHQVCPYSRATRGNIKVTLTLVE